MKSAKLIFPMLIFSVFFAEPIMICMYGEEYAQSSIYFIIKNISGLLYIIPFYPIILAIGKTRSYAHVHALIAFIVVGAEYVVCQVGNSAVFVALVSEICQVLKIVLLMKIVVQYAHGKVMDLLPLKSFGGLLLVSALASLLPCVLQKYVDLGNVPSLLLSFGLFLINYYMLCKLFGITYKEVVAGLVKKNSACGIIAKCLP